MQIAVITVQREPMYLYHTLASLFESLADVWPHAMPTISVFIGTPDAERIETKLAKIEAPKLAWHRIPTDLWTLIEPLPPKLRAVGNFVAALRSGEGDLMIFEDDIAIKPGWLDAVKLDDTIWSDDAPLDPAHTFISLYSHRDLRTPGFSTCAARLRWPIKHFYGTLGLFVPAAHRQGLAEAALIHLQPDDPRPVEQRWPFDEIVKIYVNDHRQCSLVVTIPSYVDHRGDISVINPTHGVRRAPMF